MGRIKLTDKKKKKIIADYMINQNYSETARLNNVAGNSVRKIILNDKDFAKKVEQKKEEDTKTTLEYMEEQHKTKKEIVENVLNAINTKCQNLDMFTNVKDLATAYGIIIDKELKFEELKLKRRELELKEKELKLRERDGSNFEELSVNLVNIAKLINNPIKTRTECDVNE